MLFNSWEFVPFALIVYALYYVLPRVWQNRLLLVASYIFYAAWDWRFVGLLWLSTGLDFVIAQKIDAADDERRRKHLLVISCIVNFGILGVFKYFNFFADSFHDLLSSIGIETTIGRLNVILPLGISFYTFETVSYSIDVYRRRIHAERELDTFALFLAYFPHLVAGPVVRARQLIPQLKEKRIVNRHLIGEGAWLIVLGLFKKIVIADNVAIFVDQTFATSHPSSGGAALLAVYAFAVQIYCDFSGYSDIARGLAKLMGIDIPLNFRLPYLATNPSDLWKRWHISLSTWLQDYLYVPLGGNRRGTWRTYRNLMITMVLGGLWHGAAWTFVVWGAFHGLLLIAHRTYVQWRPPDPARAALTGYRRVAAIVVMFNLTCIGWLFFRASSLAQAGHFLTAIVTDLQLDDAAVRIAAGIAFFGGMLVLIEGWMRNTDTPSIRPGWSSGLGAAVVVAMVVAMVILVPPGNRSFIYFQF